MAGPTQLRETRAALLANGTVRGRAFGDALAGQLDLALASTFERLDCKAGVALVALGSYGRRELCPGSDIDVLLLHSLRGRRGAAAVRSMTEELWYPLWDAGFVTGHGARTVRESIALADEELDALTALLEARHVAGNPALTDELIRRGRELAQRRQARVLGALADAAERRRARPGPVAEVLEPDLKDGAGGLRDIQSLEWAGWTFGHPGSTEALQARGYVAPDDLHRCFAARELLLDLRVALQRVTGTRADRLVLQEQDAVADALAFDDADDLVRKLAAAARDVAWTTRDVWMRVRDGLAGPSGRVGRGDEILSEGVVLRDGRVHVRADNGSMTPLRALEAAAAAAEVNAPFDRTSLERLASMSEPTWDVWERAAFLRLLRAGAAAVSVFEALDHQRVLVKLLPEWEHVRSRPQRNAYHRYTVDRHLLEAVAECARLLDKGDADVGAADQSEEFDRVVARATRRPELLLLGALLHDIGKGMPGDHSDAGAQTALRIARRMRLDSEGVEIVEWLVRNHLLMADVATRRDLSDASVADNLAAACASDAERLRLLYLLTLGDSRATGPAAWSPTKAALVRDLFIKAAAAVERGEARALAADRREDLAARLGERDAAELLARLPEEYVLAFDDATMAAHAKLLEARFAVRCERDDQQVTVTVVAGDRPGLLATLAGALTLVGLDVLEANLFTTTDGYALDVFRAADPFGRVVDDGKRVEEAIEAALEGELDLASRVAERGRAYRGSRPSGPVAVDVDVDESDTDTVVEVHADDEVGLLFRLASALAELDLDVRVAKVATLGQRVVDVFYVRDATGRKIDSPDAVQILREALTDRLRPE
jgi:[protein-PII] uridylyltransferase